jgi:thioredoxin-related protein
MKTIVKIIMMIIVYMPLNTIAQGIQFEEGLNWEQVQAKAKKLSKSIFVDCYATWCGPCKEMDKTVFTDASVGKYMNDSFISLRVQMDSTTNDVTNIKLLYPLAKTFTEKYQIASLPTFLFFSSNGTLLHKGIGGKTTKSFNLLIKDANNPDKQYYTKVTNWRIGKTPVTDLPALAILVRNEYKDKTIAKEIARDYISRYLNLLEGSRFYSNENLSFITEFASVVTSGDNVFKFIYNNSGTVDSIMKIKDYAKIAIKVVVTNEEINPIVNKADNALKTPDWELAEKVVARKFNKVIAYLSVLDAKVNWYNKNRKTVEHTIYFVKQMEAYGVDRAPFDYLNAAAWNVFKYSNDKKMIKKALAWSNMSISKSVSGYDSLTCMDTKACLLYKIGKKAEAINVEEEAMIRVPYYAPILRKKLEKMKKGEDISMLD